MGRAKALRLPRIEGDVAYMTLARGGEAIVDLVDLHLVAGYSWFKSHATKKDFTVNRCERNKHYCMADAIKPPPPGKVVDHKDGNPLNCRRYNLRHATFRQNAMNRATTNSTGFKGVQRIKLRFKAQLEHAGKYHYLGLHLTAEAAARAYDEAARRLFGEFAAVNFPTDSERSGIARPATNIS